jgi:leucyl aminopeptidase
MDVATTVASPLQTPADTVVFAVFEGDDAAHPALQALLDSGEAKRSHGAVALAHDDDGRRLLLAGLGARAEFDAERARVSAAKVAARASELAARHLCWALPDGGDAAIAAALVEGTVLASYRFDRYREPAADPAERPPPVGALTVSGPGEIAVAVERAHIAAAAANDARTLQDTPANDLTPGDLAARAARHGDELDGLIVTVERRAEIAARGMGAFTAVAQGSDAEPALITMRYEGPAAHGPLLGFIGKALTFDSGGISLKPGEGMEEMKYDMSGGAAVIEAVAAIARLALPVRVLGVIGASENMPSGHSVKPGDIVRTMAGLTVEINNTDAEGRLVLADCIAHALAEGAERLVDLATLTGSIVVALGRAHAGLFSNDDAWSEQVSAAGRRSGELLWRMPLHREYADAVKGTFADLNNAPAGRRAGSITAAEFLHRFAGTTPWAHLDIAGTAWDRGTAYAATGGSGFGVRLLVELAGAAGAAGAAG